MMRIARLDDYLPDDFPDPARALAEPNGLLAFGGDLSPRRLLSAYRRGIFPWYSEGDPLLWWSPDPRCVFATDRVHVSHSLARVLRKSRWRWSLDRAFDAVIAACAEPRDGQDGTWITPDMIRAYTNLHLLGHAHSVEVWDEDELVGGLYGVGAGRAFSAESMFSRRTNASKIALVMLARFLHRHQCALIDAQIVNPHLLRMGAFTIPRRHFLAAWAGLVDAPELPAWPRTLQPLS